MATATTEPYVRIERMPKRGGNFYSIPLASNERVVTAFTVGEKVYMVIQGGA